MLRTYVLAVATASVICNGLEINRHTHTRSASGGHVRDEHSGTEWKNLVFLSNAVVSCKGQVFVKNEKAKNGWQSADIVYDGCGHGRGSCKQPKWTKGPYLEGPDTCTSPDNEFMLQECTMPQELSRIVVITQPQWGAYYHFLVDSLPRIVWVKDQAPYLLEDPKTYFHVGMTSEMGQSWARLVGINTEFTEGTSAGEMSPRGPNRLLQGWWSARTVVWPPSNGCVSSMATASPHPAEPHAIEGMRQIISESMATMVAAEAPVELVQEEQPQKKNGFKPLQGGGTLMLIQRHPKMGKARVLLNHMELLQALQSKMKGWKVVVFSDYPAPDVKTTCQMFHQADIIVGPHGAGFSNLICAKDKVPVVEIQQTPHSHDFQLLTGMLKLPYFGMPTEMTHGGSHTVNVTQVLEYVDQVLEFRQPKKPVSKHGAGQLPVPEGYHRAPFEDALVLAAQIHAKHPSRMAAGQTVNLIDAAMLEKIKHNL